MSIIIIFHLSAEAIKKQIEQNERLIELASPSKQDIEILVTGYLAEKDPQFLSKIEQKISGLEKEGRGPLDKMSFEEIRHLLQDDSKND